MASYEIGKYFDIDTYIDFFNNLTTELLIAMIIVLLALMIFFIIVNWKIYKKIGLHGWVSLIPIYNTIVLLKKIGMSWVNTILIFFPIVHIYIYIEIMRNLCASFGKEKLFTLFSILFPFFALPIIAFGSSSYIYDLNKEEQDDVQVENVDSEYIYCPKCNTRLATNATSCFICGYKLNDNDNLNTKNENNNVNNISVGAKMTSLWENSNLVSELPNNQMQVSNQLPINEMGQSTFNNSDNNHLINNELFSTRNFENIDNIQNQDSKLTNSNQNSNNEAMTNNFFDNSLTNDNNQNVTSNNNTSSIEEMFNFHYDNINEANSLINNRENPINVNNNGFLNTEINKQSDNNIFNFENSNLVNSNVGQNLFDNSIPELSNSININQEEEIIDFDIQSQEVNRDSISENTEIIDFPTAELKLNEEVSILGKEKTEIDNLSEINDIVKEIVPDSANDLSQNDSANNSFKISQSLDKTNTNYRLCPICGSKVLPNATNCVICGSKVS